MAEQKLLQLQSKHIRKAKLLKKAKEKVCTLQRQCNNPVKPYEAFQGCHGTFPNVTIVFPIIHVRPISGTVVKKIFIMNLITNDLRRSMNIKTLNALITVNYVTL